MLQAISYRLAMPILVMLVSTARFAAADPTDYGCDRPIHVAYYEFGALFHGDLGIDPDLIHELAKRTGCIFEESVKPRVQIWEELEAGTLDMTNSGVRTEARRKFVYFVPYLGWKNVVVTTPELAAEVHSFDDIIAHPEWRIGVVKGYVHGPFYDFRLKLATIAGSVSLYPDQSAIYQALRSGEVQVIISPAVNFNFYLRTPTDQQSFVMLDLSPAPPIPHNLIFATARFSASEINAWTRLFEEMRLDGTLERIYQAHLPTEMAKAILHY